MPTTTTRLGLAQPIGADAASELRVAIASNATGLDGAILSSVGTLSARPSSPTVAPAVYKATDTGLTYWWDGAKWHTVSYGLEYASTSSSATLAVGCMTAFIGSGPATLTLPSSAATGATVGIHVSTGSVSGSSPVTVSAPSGVITFVGSSAGAATQVLGTSNACVILQLDSSGNWMTVGGEWDTGWIPLTLGSSISAASGYPTPAARQVSSSVEMQGALLTSGLTSNNATIATLNGVTAPPGTEGGLLATINGAAIATYWSIASGASTLKNVTGQNASVTMPLGDISYDVT